MAEACRSAPHGETAARCARAWRGEPTSIGLGQRNLVRSGEGSVAPRAVQPAAILGVQLWLHTPTVMMYAPACGFLRSEHGCCANSAKFADTSTTRALRRLHAPTLSQRRVCSPFVGACADNCGTTSSLAGLSRVLRLVTHVCKLLEALFQSVQPRKRALHAYPSSERPARGAHMRRGSAKRARTTADLQQVC